MGNSDPAWGMPTINWGPTSSYWQPALPPLLDPDAAPLVQLPCVNQGWVQLILGSLDQLRNPGSWDPSIGEAGLSLVLSRVNLLRSMMSGTVSTPCCAVKLRLTQSCELQWSVDGGTNWATADGWDLYLDGCIKAHIPPQVPVPLQPGLTTAQRACDTATFLALNVMQAAAQQEVTAATQNVALLDALKEVTALLAPIFPITVFGVQAFTDLYELYVLINEAHWQTAVSDVSLWNLVKCAIYAAIHNDGYVTAANYPIAGANIAAITYQYADVVAGIAHTWNTLGLQNIQGLQQEATALVNADCSGCALPFCHEYNFRQGPQGFISPYPGAGTWMGGGWWEGGYLGINDTTQLWIAGPQAPAPVNATQAVVDYLGAGAGSGSNINHIPHITTFLAGNQVQTVTLPLGIPANETRAVLPLDGSPIDSISLYLIAEGHVNDEQCFFIELSGTTSGPWAGQTCAD